jgi:hypothetical protein
VTRRSAKVLKFGSSKVAVGSLEFRPAEAGQSCSIGIIDIFEIADDFEKLDGLDTLERTA